MAKQTFDYHVALSFAGENRPYVEKVANLLRDAGLRVFYDDAEKIKLWGKDLHDYLDEIYRFKSRYCIMFISEAYRDKIWPDHERQSALARAMREKGEYILPARFDDTEISGLRPTVHYIDLRNITPEQFAEMVLAKIGGDHDRGPQTGEIVTPSGKEFRQPKMSNRSFNPYDEAMRFIDFASAKLANRGRALASQGVSVSMFDREGRRCVRVVRDGEAVFALDMWFGGAMGDASLGFYGGRGRLTGGSNAYNAWGEMVWDRDRACAVLDLHDMSLLGFMSENKRYTPSEFVDAVWEVICNALEQHD